MEAAHSHRVRSLSTSLFLKTLLAISGAGWFFFLLNHLYSNFHVFLGRDAFNAYYEGLKASPAILWGIRAVLLAGFVVHVGTAFVITKRSIDARPARYRVKKDVVTTYAARTMKWTGPIVGLYLVYHLLHFTIGSAMPAGLPFDASDPYGNVVRSFQVPWVALVYVLANLALTLHLSHGVSSVFQSLGLVNGWADKGRHWIATGLGVGMSLGFASIPLAVLFGLVR